MLVQILSGPTTSTYAEVVAEHYYTDGDPDSSASASQLEDLLPALGGNPAPEPGGWPTGTAIGLAGLSIAPTAIRRIPPGFAARDPWEAIGVSSLERAQFIDPEWAHRQMTGTPIDRVVDLEQVEDELILLQFMYRLDVDASVAYGLRHQGAAEPRSFEDLALMSETTLGLLVNDLAQGRPVSGLYRHILTAAQAASTWRSDVVLERLAWGPDVETLRTVARRWGKKGMGLGRVKSRTSATHLRDVLRLMAAYTAVAEASAADDSTTFLAAYDQLYDDIHDWVGSSTSVRNVVQKVGGVLAELQMTDVEEVATSLGSTRPMALKAVTGADLVDSSLIQLAPEAKVHDANPDGIAPASSVFVESSSFGFPYVTLTTDRPKYMVMQQHVASTPFSLMTQADTNRIVEASPLSALAPVISELAGSLQMTSEAQARQPHADHITDVLSNHISYTPNASKAPDLTHVVTVDESFAVAYIANVLEPYLDEVDPPGFDVETFRDPSAFLNALPILMVRALPMAKAVATGTGWQVAAALYAGGNAEFPDDLHMLYDAFQVDSVSTTGTIVDGLDDLSGNELHMGSSSTKPTRPTTPLYPGPSGSVALPVLGSGKLRHYLPSSERYLGDCSFVVWCPAPERSNDRFVGGCLIGESGYGMLGIQIKYNKYGLIHGNSWAGLGATALDAPSPDGWLVAGVRRWVNGDGTIDYNVVVIGGADADSGANLLLGDAVETTTQPEHSRFNKFRGMRIGNRAGLVVGGAVLVDRRLPGDSFRELVVASARRLGEAQAQRVAEILEVNLGGYDLDREGENWPGPELPPAGMVEQAVYQSSRDLNKKADEYYIAGQWQQAKSVYSQVLDLHAQRRSLGNFYSRLDVVYRDMQQRAAAGSPPSLLEYTTASPETGTVAMMLYRPVGEVPEGLLYIPGLMDVPVARVDDGLLKAEILHAYAKKTAIDDELNFLGYPPDHVPNWSYDRLVEAAVALTEHVEGLQERGLRFLQESYREGQQLAAAEQVVEEANHARSAAAASLDEAKAEHAEADSAVRRAEKTKALRTTALIGVAAATITVTALTAGAGTVAVSGAVATSVSAGGSAVGGVQRVFNAVKAAKARRTTSAKALALRRAELDEAALEALHASELVTYLENTTLDAAAYVELGVTVERIARRLMTRAHQLAWLAERALVRESLTSRGEIQLRYSNRYIKLSRFYSASQLRFSLAQLSAVRVMENRSPRSLIKVTVPLSVVDPTALHQLQTSGEAAVRIGVGWFDRRFPGTYLRQIKTIQVDVFGSLSGEVSGTLSAVEGGWVRVPNTKAFRQREAQVDPYFAVDHVLDTVDDTPVSPFAVVPAVAAAGHLTFSSFDAVVDRAVYEVEAGTLRPMEHHGVDTLWLLELSPESQSRRGEVADVLLTFYFTAAHDGRLRQQQEAHWASVARTASVRAFSSWTEPEQLFDAQRDGQSGTSGRTAMFVLDVPESAQQGVGQLQDLAIRLHGLPAGVPIDVSYGSTHHWIRCWTDEGGICVSALQDVDLYVDAKNTVSATPGGELLYSGRSPEDAPLNALTAAGIAAGGPLGPVRIKLTADATSPDWLVKKRDDGTVDHASVPEVLFGKNGLVELGTTTPIERIRFYLEALSSGTKWELLGPFQLTGSIPTVLRTPLGVRVELGELVVDITTTAEAFTVDIWHADGVVQMAVDGQLVGGAPALAGVSVLRMQGTECRVSAVHVDESSGLAPLELSTQTVVLENADATLVTSDRPVLALESLTDVSSVITFSVVSSS